MKTLRTTKQPNVSHSLFSSHAKIILIEAYPCNNKDELHAREQYWMDQFKDNIINKQNAKGLNLENYKQQYQQYQKQCFYCDQSMRGDNFI